MATKYLVLFYNTPLHYGVANTISEHISSFDRYSQYPILSVNTFLRLPQSLYSVDIAGIILHYSLFGTSEFCLDETYLGFLRRHQNITKIAFFQDEYQYCKMRFNFIDDYNVGIIFSLFQEKDFQAIYYDNTKVFKVYNTLTGYVGEDLLELSNKYIREYDERELLIGYRARALPFYMGAGAQEKAEIGYAFSDFLKSKTAKYDISMKEEDRIYGDSWIEFLGNSVACLGVDSGVSIVDLDGGMRKKYNEILKKTPHISFDEITELLLKEYENNYFYRAISPRCFEAAVMRTALVMYEGYYNGILIANEHYFELKKDLSNIQEVYECLINQNEVKRITDNCYSHLIESGNFTYQKFIEEFDKILRENAIELEMDKESTEIAKQVIAYEQYQNIYFKRMVWFVKYNLLYRKYPGKEFLLYLYRKYLKKGK